MIDTKAPLYDSYGYQHFLVAATPLQVVTRLYSNFCVWDRRTGRCLLAEGDTLTLSNTAPQIILTDPAEPSLFPEGISFPPPNIFAGSEDAQVLMEPGAQDVRDDGTSMTLRLALEAAHTALHADNGAQSGGDDNKTLQLLWLALNRAVHVLRKREEQATIVSYQLQLLRIFRQALPLLAGAQSVHLVRALDRTIQTTVADPAFVARATGYTIKVEIEGIHTSCHVFAADPDSAVMQYALLMEERLKHPFRLVALQDDRGVSCLARVSSVWPRSQPVPQVA
jgi:hypothetical protein